MKEKAIALLCVTLMFLLTPLMLPSFDGYDPEDFPVQILRPSVQPAGYAFSIWLLIYAGLLAHAVYSLVRQSENPGWDRPRLALMAAMGAGTLWVAFAEDQPGVATCVILAMLVFALAAVFRAPAAPGFLARTPVALFAGWVTAAAGAASGVTLAGLGWLSDTGAALAALAGVLAIALPVQWRLGRVPEYGGAVIWALIGIMVANRGLNPAVLAAAGAGALAMAATLALRYRR